MNQQNKLKNEISPYLLQHADNPVNWIAYSKEIFEIAQKEDKLILFSIGYSACHWCHVMAHESFEDIETATIMNENFICVKIDREERPDIDNIYMEAVNLITGRGGWPLNCFALPDGRPVWGGTYFPTSSWQKILNNLAVGYKYNKNEFINNAGELMNYIEKPQILKNLDVEKFNFRENIKNSVSQLLNQFDYENGGIIGAPKFPMPDYWIFLMLFAKIYNDKQISNHIEFTLNALASGGIFDHVGGGFCRYSVDDKWHVPHFEKMLYDNAQLLSLYSKAAIHFKNEDFSHISNKIFNFLIREMKSPEGGFYSAYDADSEGVEGKFYVWDYEELSQILGNKIDSFSNYFHTFEIGNWENGVNVLFKKPSSEWKIFDNELKKLYQTRNSRIKPQLDDKIICSWNSLVVDGFLNSSNILNSIEEAEKLLNFILKNFIVDDKLFRIYKNGKVKNIAVLDDYAFLIHALLHSYSLTFNEDKLVLAKKLCDDAITQFYDEKSGFFFFTSSEATDVIIRKIELSDNVIPCGNSVMAKNLFLLSRYFRSDFYTSIYKRMLENISAQVLKSPLYFATWAKIKLLDENIFTEIVVINKNKDYKDIIVEINKLQRIDLLIVCLQNSTNLPMINEKLELKTDGIFVCNQNGCFPTVKTFEDVMKIVEGSQLLQSGN